MISFEKVFGLANKKEKRSGSDYIATVTSIDGQTAHVQITGSDITDTPVALTIDCNPGDTVRVRIADGKAWITGNDTAPPGNTKKLVLSVDGKMDADMKNRAATIVIDEGTIEFNGNTLVINSNNFQLDKQGNGTFSGKLKAATGSFAGSVSFAFGNAKVYIGDENKTSPIRLEEIGDGYSLITYIDTVTFAQEQRMTGMPLMRSILQPGTLLFNSNNKTGQYDVDGYTGPSDVRLKEDITDLDPETAKQLRPVRFRFKGEDNIRYGFIAQEVQPILPGAVTENSEGYLGLRYQEIIAPLTALVLDQEKRIQELEKTVAELKETRNGNNNT